MDQDPRIDEQWDALERLVQVFWVVLALFGVAVGFVLIPDSISRLGTSDEWAWAGTLILFVVYVGLGAAYFWAALNEKAILKRTALPFIPALPSYLGLLVAVMVLTWIALAVGVFQPPLFASVLVLVKAEESVNMWVARREIRHGAAGLLAESSSPTARWRTQILVEYYFGHPWDPLLAIEMLLLAGAASVGWYLAANRSPNGDIGSFLVCVAIAAIVVFNEVVVYQWRVERNRGLSRDAPERSSGVEREVAPLILPEPVRPPNPRRRPSKVPTPRKPGANG